MTVESVRRPLGSGAGAGALTTGRGLHVGLLVGFHAVIGVLMFRYEWIAMGHLFATVAIGFGLLAARRSTPIAVLMASYVASSEVLWRMCDGYLFWEQGKYLLILFLGIGFLFSHSRGSRIEQMAIAIPLLLAPSCALTLSYLGLTQESRQAIAFNLAGPVALAIAALVMARVDLREIDARTLLVTLLLPLVSTAAIVLYSAATADRLFFTGESSLELSGFYGPNQVSAILGLGALCSLALGLAAHSRRGRIAWIALASLLLVQAMLTFSRGGVLAAGFAMLVLIIHLVSDPQRRRTLLAMTAVLALIALVWVVPRLNEFTSGSLADRYGEWELSGREEIMWGDLELWRQHPWLGVGPGLSAHLRTARRGRPAHTEFTRLLAEHGLLGLLAGALILAIPWLAYRRSPNTTAKAWVACFGVWTLLGMLHAATRIAAISLVYGLAVVVWPDGRSKRVDDSSADDREDDAGA